MLSKAKTLHGYKLACLDGEIGNVSEFYFDDRHWTIRYLVADTGSWLKGRHVLISPYALNCAIASEHSFSIDLTKKQIEDSPPIDSDLPVSQQFEQSYYDYYGWPRYWDGPNMWGAYPYLERDRSRWRHYAKDEGWDTHLRSTHEVTGYHLHALDGEIGHVEDFIIDDERTWAIRYLIADTKNWWPGKHVLISPQWVQRVSWLDQQVFVDLSRESIKASPEFTADSLLTRGYEHGLYGHYGRNGYWMDAIGAAA
ncbi:MAG: PRC-barrel domain-containing protein [Kofleriaceae bacterium]